MGSAKSAPSAIAVATAYTDVVNRRLKELLAAADIDVLSLECFDIVEFGGPPRRARPTSSR